MKRLPDRDIGETFRARLASMTDDEKAAAFERLRRAIFEPTDDEIADQIDAMTDEEIDAELRADGVDPDAWAAEMRARVDAARRGQ